MVTIDSKRELRDQYSATTTPTLVQVPPRPHLMVDGAGDPNLVPAYREAVETLYPLAYALRAAVKEATGDAYTVMPLEGLWWADDMSRFSVDAKDEWRWTMMISLPAVVTQVEAEDVVARAARAKDLPAGDRVRLEPFGDGLAAQVLHVGPFATEPPTIDGLHAFVAAQGLALSGRHHEIYLSDPRRAAPEKMRTIIRQPVAPA
ncbi:GyrI-like domain-containing protein [Isoptericola sp. NEAU-Y5]|uniref:GyrI-like domain-containing protein n=1 Tax=Isoptericola luteus TaxID=2879484 RepID=A0ABS7ZFM4_9MICO|nr:GyrI-like domain-containing protein [Isoptericola sp. NEAU-Y5]MCA5892595.1 GyrI-like domain-containing protein [Isoptericola sp. NEAU-Y5]